MSTTCSTADTAIAFGGSEGNAGASNKDTIREFANMASKKYANRIIETRRVAAQALRKNPLNFRAHPKTQMKALRASLRFLGKIAPLIAYEHPDHGLTLIDGHARLEEDGEWDVAIVDLSPQEADLALTMLDPIAAMAETDKNTLESLIGTIEATDADVLLHLEQLTTANGIVPDTEPLQDDPTILDKAEELLGKWQVATGDVWRIGEHTIVCGDSTDEAFVARALQGRKPFMMVTDPPYGVEYVAAWRDRELGGKQGGRAIGKVTNDDRSDWQRAYELSNADVAYVWHTSHKIVEAFFSIAQADYEIRTLIVWRKSNLVISRGHYHHQHEICFYAVRKGCTAKWCGDRKQSTVWDIDKPHKSETGHSTQKPVECMARPIRNHGARGDLIYDPFCGSGTTLVACQQEGRIGVGIEAERVGET